MAKCGSNWAGISGFCIGALALLLCELPWLLALFGLSTTTGLISAQWTARLEIAGVVAMLVGIALLIRRHIKNRPVPAKD